MYEQEYHCGPSCRNPCCSPHALATPGRHPSRTFCDCFLGHVTSWTRPPVEFHLTEFVQLIPVGFSHEQTTLGGLTVTVKRNHY